MDRIAGNFRKVEILHFIRLDPILLKFIFKIVNIKAQMQTINTQIMKIIPRKILLECEIAK